MKVRRPHYAHPQRNNAGAIIPEFILHAALADLPSQLGSGTYGTGSLEEPIIKVVRGLSQEALDGVFHALQNRPPRVSLSFPTDPAELPSIVVHKESMALDQKILADDAGAIEEGRTYVDSTDGTGEELLLHGPATGGETTVYLPVPGEPIATGTILEVLRGGSRIRLDYPDDFSLDNRKKEITLLSPLVSGDYLYATRYAYYGLPPGDLLATTFRYNYVIFVDSESPVVTKVLSAIVWREIVLKQSAILSAGLTVDSFSIRTYSLWSEVAPALGYREECVVEGLTTWLAYSRTIGIRSLDVDIYRTEDTSSPVLEMTTPIAVWTGVPDPDGE